MLGPCVRCIDTCTHAHNLCGLSHSAAGRFGLSGALLYVYGVTIASFSLAKKHINARNCQCVKIDSEFANPKPFVYVFFFLSHCSLSFFTSNPAFLCSVCFTNLVWILVPLNAKLVKWMEFYSTFLQCHSSADCLPARCWHPNLEQFKDGEADWDWAGFADNLLVIRQTSLTEPQSAPDKQRVNHQSNAGAGVTLSIVNVDVWNRCATSVFARPKI